MQEQEFTTDQNSENTESQESFSTEPETVVSPDYIIGEEPVEQETVFFSQPTENTGQTVSSADEELFGKYEIKNWDFTPRIYKIFAASAILNILFLLTVAQTNILRTKACDSPLVSGFCQVLDTVYVGSKILGTDDEFVSQPYEKTELEDAEIVWLDRTGDEPPLTYPAGYFQIANPEMFPTEDPLAQNFDNSGFPSIVNQAPPMANPTLPNPIMPSVPNNSGVMNRQQRLPKANKNAIPSDLPTGIDLNPTDETTADAKKPKNSPKENVADNKKPEEKPKQPGLSTMPVAEEIINKKPLQDFADNVVDKVGNREIDLSKAFSVVMVGTITEDGKFDQKKSAYLKSSGDQAMIDVAKSAIEAIGDSGILTYLKRLDVNQIKFELVQDDKEIYAIITSNQKSENDAKKVSSGLNGYLAIGKMTVKEEDTLTLINAAKVESKDKTFLLNFNIEKVIAQQLIKRQLEKAEAKRKAAEQTKPNSTAQTANRNINTGK